MNFALADIQIQNPQDHLIRNDVELSAHPHGDEKEDEDVRKKPKLARRRVNLSTFFSSRALGCSRALAAFDQQPELERRGFTLSF